MTRFWNRAIFAFVSSVGYANGAAPPSSFPLFPIAVMGAGDSRLMQRAGGALFDLGHVAVWQPFGGRLLTYLPVPSL